MLPQGVSSHSSLQDTNTSLEDRVSPFFKPTHSSHSDTKPCISLPPPSVHSSLPLPLSWLERFLPTLDHSTTRSRLRIVVQMSCKVDSTARTMTIKVCRSSPRHSESILKQPANHLRSSVRVLQRCYLRRHLLARQRETTR